MDGGALDAEELPGSVAEDVLQEAARAPAAVRAQLLRGPAEPGGTAAAAQLRGLPQHGPAAKLQLPLSSSLSRTRTSRR